MPAADHPLCFPTAESYRVWCAAAKLTEVTTRHWHCTDCLPEYKRDMLRAGRCAHADVTFRVDEDGFTEGRRPLLKKEKNP